MKNIKLVLACFALFITTLVIGVPAKPFPITAQQPDGTSLIIRLNGDEYYSYKTTIDGYKIDKNADGFFVYLTLDNNQNWVLSEVIARNVEDRTPEDVEFLHTIDLAKEQQVISEQYHRSRNKIVEEEPALKKVYPLSGSPKALVILVNYKDIKFCVDNPNTAFKNMLNQKGYAENYGTGSAKDYFEDVSESQFSPQFDVYGPYELPKNRSYYGMNKTNGNDSNSRQMIKDACSLAVANGVIMSDYDTDHDGYIDNIFVYFAGVNEAEGGPASSIWPHQWTISPPPKSSAPSYGGVKAWTYACTSELKDDVDDFPQNMCGIGTFVHEFCHVLGLPEYYTTDDVSTLPTPYYWSTMDYGSYLNNGRTPPSPSGYDRFYLGWLTPAQIDTPQNVIIPPLNSSKKAYLIAKTTHNMIGTLPNPKEFFILENRAQQGWDAYLPFHGMLIWHITYNATKWTGNVVNNTNPQGVYLVRADSTTTRTYYNTFSDPFPGTKNVGSYKAKLWNDATFSATLSDIKEINNNIFFKLNGGEATYLKTDLDTIYVGFTNNLSTSFMTYSNSTWKVSCPDTWIRLSDTVGVGNQLVTATAAPSAQIVRYATITVTSGELTAKVVVCQSGQLVPTLRLRLAQQLPENSVKLTAVIEHKDVVTECGFYVSSENEFTEDDKYLSEVRDTFSLILSDLIPGQKYYYKAYLKYDTKTIYTWVGSFVVHTVVNINDADPVGSKIQLFPNPVTDKFIIQTENIAVYKIDIFDIFGRKITSTPAHIEASSQKEVDIANLHSGLYVVRMTTDKGIVLRKILKK